MTRDDEADRSHLELIVPFEAEWFLSRVDTEVFRRMRRVASSWAIADAIERDGLGDALDRGTIQALLEQVCDDAALRAAVLQAYTSAFSYCLFEQLKTTINLTYVSYDDVLLATAPVSDLAAVFACSAVRQHAKLRARLDKTTFDELIEKPLKAWTSLELSLLLESSVNIKRCRAKIVRHVKVTDGFAPDRFLDSNKLNNWMGIFRNLYRERQQLAFLHNSDIQGAMN